MILAWWQWLIVFGAIAWGLDNMRRLDAQIAVQYGRPVPPWAPRKMRRGAGGVRGGPAAALRSS